MTEIRKHRGGNVHCSASFAVATVDAVEAVAPEWQLRPRPPNTAISLATFYEQQSFRKGLDIARSSCNVKLASAYNQHLNALDHVLDCAHVLQLARHATQDFPALPSHTVPVAAAHAAYRRGRKEREANSHPNLESELGMVVQVR
jgi:hypothetical protein